jgi:hypothetical protein
MKVKMLWKVCKDKKSYLIKFFLIFGSILGFFALSLFLIESIPQYIDSEIPFLKKSESGNPIKWDINSTYSNVVMADLKFFVHRQEAYVPYDELLGITNTQSILNYFDDKLAQVGWVRTDQSVDCGEFLPELFVLADSGLDSENVHYLRKEDAKLGNYDSNGYICLSIWKGKQITPRVWYVTFVTVNPTFLTSWLMTFSRL